MELPGDENEYQVEHAAILLRSFRMLTGSDLIPGGFEPSQEAKLLFEAPFFVASHDGGEDPVLNYGNRTALELFELPWEDFTKTPSRFTAEEPERGERERLLEAVTRQGFIDDYSGIRISKSGRRFEIRNAIVWNLLNEEGLKVGQAATFESWRYL
ncbi:MAG: MEKHLA domain-containing protein [Verrucomicrobiales bacterium]|nr:MEKHLA domain-containing protein [Verrucomicrobiales bacterium]